jgi:hypothetical protein
MSSQNLVPAQVVYQYRDEGGQLNFEIVRKPNGKFAGRRPNPTKPGSPLWDLNGTRRDLVYNLPDLLKAEKTQTVFIVEGERRADILKRHKLLATTNPLGPGRWRDEHSKWFRDRRIVVIPDNDQRGIEHADQIAFSVSKVAASTRIVNLPGLAAGESVDEWLAHGGTPQILQEMLETVPEWSPSLDSPLKSGDYEWRLNGLYWLKRKDDQVIPMKLTNFTATILADVVMDDGVERRREYEIEATLQNRTSRFRIPANHFSSLN